jgi:hypothetical protein
VVPRAERSLAFSMSPAFSSLRTLYWMLARSSRFMKRLMSDRLLGRSRVAMMCSTMLSCPLKLVSPEAPASPCRL